MRHMHTLVLIFLMLAVPTMARAKTLLEIDFKNGTPGEQPEGWQDQRQGVNPPATIVCDPDNHGAIEIMNDAGWGSVRYMPLTMNPEQYGGLEVEVEQMDARSSLVVDLYTEEPRENIFNCGRIGQPGLYSYDLKQIVPTPGVHSYGIQITLEGKRHMRASLRRLRIFGVDNARVIDYPYMADFKVDRHRRPEDWRGGHNNADIYGTLEGEAEITLGPEKDFGDVLSPIFAQTAKQPYERFRFDLAELTPEANLVVVLQEEHGSARHFVLLDQVHAPGKYQAEIAPLLQFHKIERFSIKVWLNGKAGQSRAVVRGFEVLQSQGTNSAHERLAGGAESDEHRIVFAVERRVYEDFDNIQKVKLVSGELEKMLTGLSQVPVKILYLNEAELMGAYQRGDLDMIVTYRDFFTRCAQAGFLHPVLTTLRKGRSRQTCGIYVRAHESATRFDFLHAAKIGLTSERVRGEVERYIHGTKPGMTFEHYFKQAVVLENVRDLLLEMQLKKVDAIAEFEYVESVAKKMKVELRKLAELSSTQNNALYLRRSCNSKKNITMEQMLTWLEHADKEPAYRPFFELFDIDRFIRVQEQK